MRPIRRTCTPRAVRRIIVGELVSGVVFWTAIAVAEGAPPNVDLEWDAPSECPDRTAVHAEIDQLVVGDARDVTAIAVVTRRDDEFFHLDLEIDTAQGRQHFEWDARACGSLARGAALAIVAAADTTAVAVPAPLVVQTPTHDHVTAPTAAAAPKAVEAASLDPASTRGAADTPSSRGHVGVQGWLRLHAAAGIAQLPGFDGRFGLGGGVGWKWLRAEAIAALSLPREVRATENDVGARMLAFDVAARVGGSTSGRIAVGGMAGVEIGALRATGLDVDSPQTAGDVWIAATLGPIVTIAIARRLAFFAGLDGVVALRRPRFAIRERTASSDGEIVFRPRAGGARVWIGFGVRFGA